MKYCSKVGKSLRMGDNRAVKSQGWRGLGPMKVTVSMKDTLLRFYQVVECLRARGGRWGTEMGWEFVSTLRNLHERNV